MNEARKEGGRDGRRRKKEGGWRMEVGGRREEEGRKEEGSRKEEGGRRKEDGRKEGKQLCKCVIVQRSPILIHERKGNS